MSNFHSSLLFNNDVFILISSLFLVLVYEVLSGFHDTANAITAVIYTRAICSKVAIVTSSFLNFIGVIVGGLGVAYSIVYLLPINLLLNIKFPYNITIIYSILLSAIIWNIITWYFGLPSSSSHTLIGAIIGANIANAKINNYPLIQALNIGNLNKIFISLIISPIIGLFISGLITIFLLKIFNKNKFNIPLIHLTPLEIEKKYGKTKPPFWIRLALILSSFGISISHGSNDGQKGIGLIMLIMILIIPNNFIINIHASKEEINKTKHAIYNLHHYYSHNKILLQNILSNKQNYPSVKNNSLLNSISTIKDISNKLKNINNYQKLNYKERAQIRKSLMYISSINNKLLKSSKLTYTDKNFLKNTNKNILLTVEYAPIWIIIFVATALAIGNIFGWKRVAYTIGKKIGKYDMTYSNGLSAQITTAISVGLASYTGTPVSTTHVLSSSIVGTMLASSKEIYLKTIKNILLVWVITIPLVGIFSGSFCWFLLKIIRNFNL